MTHWRLFVGSVSFGVSVGLITGVLLFIVAELALLIRGQSL